MHIGYAVSVNYEQIRQKQGNRLHITTLLLPVCRDSVLFMRKNVKSCNFSGLSNLGGK